MKDKWRFVFMKDSNMDNIIVINNPEDFIISIIDGDYEDDGERSTGIMDRLNLLSKKEREVVDAILFEDKTFVSVGKSMSLSKQRVHQIYKTALAKMKAS